jgi:hypothetical protein
MCETWAIDGTFDAVSDIYTQLFTIHGIKKNGWVFPLVYALLPNKKTESYKYVLDQLSDNKLPGCIIRLENVILDFEMSIISALESVFPDASLRGCHFHLTQSLLRNFSKDMHVMFKEVPEFALYTRSFFALAFVPPVNVQSAFAELKGQWKTSFPVTTEFFNYVSRRYVGSRNITPRYPIQFWNAHDRVLSSIPRTNNSSEAWNRRFGVLVEISHASFFRLLLVIRKEQQCMEGAMIRHSAGRLDKTQKYSQVKLDCSIFELVTGYDNHEIELLEFLKGMAHNTWSGTRNYRRAQSEESEDQPTQLVEQQATLPTVREELNQLILPCASTSSALPCFDKQYSTAKVNRKRVRSQSQITANKRSKTDS